MATLAASSMVVHGHTNPAGGRPNGSGNNVFGCYLSGYFSGTYAQADNAAWNSVGGASGTIATSRRDGKTVTMIDACFACPGDEAGTKIGAMTVAVSGANITCELTGSDLTTEHANAALGTVGEPIMLFVTYVLS